MFSITWATVRRLIPVTGVTAILLLSFLAPTPLLRSSQQASNKSVVVTGYGNNCGVKGYGIHDHDKQCPNRPFPGRGPKD
jgi:hypothetical protein